MRLRESDTHWLPWNLQQLEPLLAVIHCPKPRDPVLIVIENGKARHVWRNTLVSLQSRFSLEVDDVFLVSAEEQEQEERDHWFFDGRKKALKQ